MKNLTRVLFAMAVMSLVIACKKKEGSNAKVSDTAGAVAKAEGKTYNVDAATSKVLWVGSKPVGKHNGTVDVSTGSVAAKDGKVTGGSFTLDMNTINTLDLEGKEKTYLDSHLKGLDDKSADDFFNVNKYPTAKFEITKVANLEGDANGNALVYGNLTLKDQTKQVSFKANIDVSDTSVKVNTGTFKINRTEWGIKYGSPSFFEGLKDKAIDDNIELQINLVANS